MAAGAEYREESDLRRAGRSVPARADLRHRSRVAAAAHAIIWAAYVEFAVPLHETLELSLAGRYDDYSDFGDTTNPKVAVRWAPIEELAFRASWGTGFRAPSLAQIGLGPSQESQFFIDTYGCADQGIAGSRVPALDYTLIFSGNPNLEAEGVGDLERRRRLAADRHACDVTLDYWDIKQEKKIDEVPFGFIYDAVLQRSEQHGVRA